MNIEKDRKERGKESRTLYVGIDLTVRIEVPVVVEVDAGTPAGEFTDEQGEQAAHEAAVKASVAAAEIDTVLMNARKAGLPSARMIILPPSLGGRIVDVACLQKEVQVDGTPLLGPEQRTLLAIGSKSRAPDAELPDSSEELPAAEREARRDERDRAE